MSEKVTEEMVERAAIAMQTVHAQEDGDPDWDELEEYWRGEMRQLARAALTAALDGERK